MSPERRGFGRLVLCLDTSVVLLELGLKHLHQSNGHNHVLGAVVEHLRGVCAPVVVQRLAELRLVDVKAVAPGFERVAPVETIGHVHRLRMEVPIPDVGEQTSERIRVSLTSPFGDHLGNSSLIASMSYPMML